MANGISIEAMIIKPEDKILQFYVCPSHEQSSLQVVHNPELM